MREFLEVIDPYLPAIIGFIGAILGAIAGFISNHRATGRQIKFQQCNFRRVVFTRYVAEREVLRDAEMHFEHANDRCESIESRIVGIVRDSAHYAGLEQARAEELDAVQRRSEAQITFHARKLEALLCISDPEDNPATLAINLIDNTESDELSQVVPAIEAAFRADVELDKKKRKELRARAFRELLKFDKARLVGPESGTP